MKKFFVLLMLAGLVVSCSSSGSREELLFILHADSGHYKDGQLVLHGVSPAVGYFADRPIRKGGTMGLHTFLDSWKTNQKNNFTDDPPNAGFVYYANLGKAFSEAFIELKNPRYNQYENVLVFDIYVIGGVYPQTSREFKEIYLFVDAIKPGFTPHKGYNAQLTQQSALECQKTPSQCLGKGPDGKSQPTQGTYNHCFNNPTKACTEIYKQHGIPLNAVTNYIREEAAGGRSPNPSVVNDYIQYHKSHGLQMPSDIQFHIQKMDQAGGLNTKSSQGGSVSGYIRIDSNE